MAAGPPAVRLSAGPAPPQLGQLPEPVGTVIRAPGVGESLPAATQKALEHTLDISLEGVSVHTDDRAAAAVDSLGARAFTYGLHIFLGSRERPTDVELMAHEVTHVVQQRGAPVIQTYGAGGGDRFEREAEQTSAAARRGGRAQVVERTEGSRVQKFRIPIISDVVDWLEDRVWGLLERFAPSLVPILRKGVFTWLKEKLSNALQALIDVAARPIRAIGDIITGVRKHFGNLLTWLRDAGARIARNDCGPISEAADKIYQVFEGLTAPAIERVKYYAMQVKEFFQGLWDRFGAPIWNLLKRIGGAIWEEIERIGRWIWEKTQPVRDWLSRAWRWLKNLIGIGEGEEGQNGILQWFQRKASAAWDWVMEKIAPFKRQLLIVAGVLVMLSPAGPIIAIGAAAAGILRGIQWIRQNMRSRSAVVQQQSFLRGTILPAILGAIDRVSGIVHGIANTITGALGRVVTGLTNLSNAVASVPILSFASGLINWIAGGFRGLLEWAIEGVQGMANWLQRGLQGVGRVARLLIDALEEIARVVGNFFRIAGGVFRRIWHAIPKCIRDPFIDYLIPLILRNIPFFSELASSPEAWQQTKAQVTTLLVQVFVNFDLIGAMKTAFGLVVRVLRIPLDLMGQLLDKASLAWDLVLARPLRFIENALKTVLMGIGRFMRNILSHLWFGVQGWLLNAVGDRSITLPSGITDWRGWLNLILDVLGLSVDHVIDLIDRRFPGAGRRLRQALNFLTGALEWLRIALTEGPRGIWRHLVDRLSDLGNAVIESAVGWVMQRIIAIISARLTALAASAGLSGVLEAIFAVYQAIKTAMEYARRIIQMLINVFDAIIQIANGVLNPAAEKLESAFRNAMPVVIGFLANYAGLGGIGERVREIIVNVRTRVDNAILALIDGVRAAIQGVLNAIKSGVQAVVDWWRVSKSFTGADRRLHKITVDRRDNRAVVTVRSAEQTLEEIIAAEPEPKRGQLQSKYSELSGLVGGSEPDPAQHEARHRRVEQITGEIAALLGSEEVRPTVVTYAVKSGGRAYRVIAEPLTSRAGNTAGSASQAGIQFKDLVSAIVEPRKQEQHRGETTSRAVFSMFRSAHLLAHPLHGPAVSWNLANAGTGINTGMSRGPESTAEKLKNKGAELRYVTTVEYHNEEAPQTDRTTLAAGTPEQKLRWLGALVAMTYRVNLSVLKPPTDGVGDARLGDLGPFDDGPNFLAGLQLRGGPAPPTAAERVLEVAIATAESTPQGRQVRGTNFLATELRLSNVAVRDALEQLASAGRLRRGQDGRYYFPD
jgi:phage-related protein